MADMDEPAAAPEPPHDLNGIATAQLLATAEILRDLPELAEVRLRATNEWISGTSSRTSVRGFYAIGGEDTTRGSAFVLAADLPSVLLGQSIGPMPAEHLLHGVAACLTVELVQLAALRGVPLVAVRSTVTGQLDLRGSFGLDDGVRRGLERVSVRFVVEADASDEVLGELLAEAVRRSAVHDVLTRGVPVSVGLMVRSGASGSDD
jgi:uncharacterized OsmC-like protein